MNNEFDIVINVESAHNYPSLPRFLSEVHRVLKPGGYFSWTDAMTKERHRLFLEAKASSTLKWVVSEDISELVRTAIRKRIYKKNVGKNVKLPSANSLLERLFVKPIWMIFLGAQFVDHKFDPISRMILNTAPTFDIATYDYALGQKQ